MTAAGVGCGVGECCFSSHDDSLRKNSHARSERLPELVTGDGCCWGAATERAEGGEDGGEAGGDAEGDRDRAGVAMRRMIMPLAAFERSATAAAAPAAYSTAPKKRLCEEKEEAGRRSGP